ncbi:MAG: dihydroneopterin aldolase [Bacillota bacterium]|nr:dihydroneopterin aldolase [Bacillota bacterium]
MDKIIMKKLQFYGYHGVLEEEKKLGQKFSVDVEIGSSLKKAGDTDNLQYTVNYALVYSDIKHIMENEKYDLIETCAEKIAAKILSFPNVSWCLVRVNKPEAPIPGIFDKVAVEIIREKQ